MIIRVMKCLLIDHVIFKKILNAESGNNSCSLMFAP